MGSLRTAGSTALGPALCVCVGLLAKDPGSEIVLCTDGQPNVGVGAFGYRREDPDAAISFYRQVGNTTDCRKKFTIGLSASIAFKLVN